MDTMKQELAAVTGQMMLLAAASAVEMAATVFEDDGFDYSEASVACLDTKLAEWASAAAWGSDDIDLQSVLWGGYLGEVLRRHHGGAWSTLSCRAGDQRDLADIVICTTGTHWSPIWCVQQRLLQGRGHSLRKAYRTAVAAVEMGRLALLS